MTEHADDLPQRYIEWLTALPDEHLVAFRKSEWQFYSLDELHQPTRVDKFKATIVTQLKAFVEMYKSLGATFADGPKNSDFPLDRLAQSLVVAVDNEDLLFTDPTDGYSMWKFEPEDCKVRPLKCDIFEMMGNAEVEDLNND